MQSGKIDFLITFFPSTACLHRERMGVEVFNGLQRSGYVTSTTHALGLLLLCSDFSSLCFAPLFSFTFHSTPHKHTNTHTFRYDFIHFFASIFFSRFLLFHSCFVHFLLCYGMWFSLLSLYSLSFSFHEACFISSLLSVYLLMLVYTRDVLQVCVYVFLADTGEAKEKTHLALQ